MKQYIPVFILVVLMLISFTQCAQRGDTEEQKFNEMRKTFIEIMPGDTFNPEDWDKKNFGFTVDIKVKDKDRYKYLIRMWPNTLSSTTENWYITTDTDGRVIQIIK